MGPACGKDMSSCGRECQVSEPSMDVRPGERSTASRPSETPASRRPPQSGYSRTPASWRSHEIRRDRSTRSSFRRPSDEVVRHKSAPARMPSVPPATRTPWVSHTRSGPDDDYNIDRESKVGEGQQGTVFSATRKKTGGIRAIKMVAKKGDQNAAEIEIMRRMDHPNIVKLFETFEDAAATYLVMELCAGGDLFDKIVDQGSLSEREAAIVMQQILRAVRYVHSNSIAHRDLKPENFIFSSKDPIGARNPLKLIDFGIACECGPGDSLKGLVGTPYYIAPQVVTARYDRRCDLWSCGVIMFVLLSGGVPFTGVNDKEILTKVRQGIVRYQKKETWNRVSEDGRHLLKRLLSRSPKDRIASEDALKHDWIRLHAPRAAAKLQCSLVDDLRDFKRQNKLKQAALTIIANEMDDDQISGLRAMFTSLDADGDGLLTLAEIKVGLKLPLSCKKRKDEDLVLDYSEFLAATISKQHHISDEACRVAFGTFDVAGSGRITAEEIERAFSGSSSSSLPIRHEDSQDIVARYGTPEGGGLDFSGFKAMVCNSVVVAS